MHFGGEERLHFIRTKAKVDFGCLPSNFVEDCTQLFLARSVRHVRSSERASQCTQLTPHRNGCRQTVRTLSPKTEMPPNSPDQHLLHYYVWTAMLKPIKNVIWSQILKTQGNAADDQGQPTSRTDQQSCKGVSKGTNSLCWSWGWTLGKFSHRVLILCCCHQGEWVHSAAFLQVT